MKGLLLTGIGFSILAVISVTGCTKRPTTLGPDFGLAYTMSNGDQTLNPDAGMNLDPVQGLEDGAAAKRTMRAGAIAAIVGWYCTEFLATR